MALEDKKSRGAVWRVSDRVSPQAGTHWAREAKEGPKGTSSRA